MLLTIKTYRKTATGAIFLIDKKTNCLYLRYSRRKKNIIFTKEVLPAINLLNNILDNNKYSLNYKMQAGDGIICNNVIHNRTSFADINNKRLMLRGRYFSRI